MKAIRLSAAFIMVALGFVQTCRADNDCVNPAGTHYTMHSENTDAGENAITWKLTSSAFQFNGAKVQQPLERIGDNINETDVRITSSQPYSEMKRARPVIYKATLSYDKNGYSLSETVTCTDWDRF